MTWWVLSSRLHRAHAPVIHLNLTAGEKGSNVIQVLPEQRRNQYPTHKKGGEVSVVGMQLYWITGV
jgi:hypothetical protein